jgi:hypothetical protein
MTHTSHTTTLRGIFVAVSILFFCLPFYTQAYFTTAQKEVDLKNGSGLFLIEYAFGMEKKEVSLPIFVSREGEVQKSLVSYEIRNEDNELVSDGNSFGIVLSGAPIEKNGMYVIPKGEAHKLVLAVFFTPLTSNTDSYRLQVSNLPFLFDGAQELSLNPSELKYYTTQLLPL